MLDFMRISGNGVGWIDVFSLGVYFFGVRGIFGVDGVG